MRITPELRELVIERMDLPPEAHDNALRWALARAFTNDLISIDEVYAALGLKNPADKQIIDDYLGRIDKAVEATLTRESKMPKPIGQPMTNPSGLTPYKLFGGAVPGQDVGSGGPRVKMANELFSTAKGAGRHDTTGLPVQYRGQNVDAPSQFDLAMAGAFIKAIAKKQGLSVNLTDTDKALWDWMCNECTWTGDLHGTWDPQISPSRAKAALLDDNTSGGLSIVPTVFDDLVITFPLLSGELFPYVQIVDLQRGQVVATGSISNPTATWGTAEGTPMTPVDCTAIVAGISTTIHPVSVAMEFGKDFLSDSPVAVGELLGGQLNQIHAAELDGVVAGGDGTSQPQGLANASGVTTVNSTNSLDGPVTYSDMESLAFAVAKQYRRRAGAVSCATT